MPWSKHQKISGFKNMSKIVDMIDFAWIGYGAKSWALHQHRMTSRDRVCVKLVKCVVLSFLRHFSALINQKDSNGKTITRFLHLHLSGISDISTLSTPRHTMWDTDPLYNMALKRYPHLFKIWRVIHFSTQNIHDFPFWVNGEFVQRDFWRCLILPFKWDIKRFVWWDRNRIIAW